MVENLCDNLAAMISAKSFDGHLPDDAEAITMSMIQVLMGTFPNTPEENFQEFANELLVAVSHRIAIERMETNPRWLQ